MDIARWFLGESGLSPRVWGVGGRLGYEDDGETPNTLIAYHDYEKAPLIFEVRGLPRGKSERGMDRFPSDEPDQGGSVCVVVHCEGGHVLVPNYSSATAFDRAGKEIKHWTGASDHFENFIEVMRSRKLNDLHGKIQEGFISSALCHTPDISYRLGNHQPPEAIREKIQGDRDAANTFDRMRHHLEANGVDLNQTPATLGEFLKMDPARLRFTNNDRANKLLTRDYRRPFVVPEKV
jgi:hypothetical protein